MTGFWQEDADYTFPEYMEARTRKMCMEVRTISKSSDGLLCPTD